MLHQLVFLNGVFVCVRVCVCERERDAHTEDTNTHKATHLIIMIIMALMEIFDVPKLWKYAAALCAYNEKTSADGNTLTHKIFHT